MMGWNTNRIRELKSREKHEHMAKEVARDRGLAWGKVLRLEYARCKLRNSKKTRGETGRGK